MAEKKRSFKEAQNMDLENNMSYANMLKQNPYMVLSDLNDNYEFPFMLNMVEVKKSLKLFTQINRNFLTSEQVITTKIMILYLEKRIHHLFQRKSKLGKFITTLIIIFHPHRLTITPTEQILIL